MTEESKSKGQEKSAPSESALSREQLIQDAPKLVGHRSADVAGALHGNSKKTFTVSEVKSLTEKWLKKPVKA